jgi:PleD family two-component response regulator
MSAGEGSRILIVEDDSDTAGVLRYYFSEKGYEVQVVAGGRGALAACRERLPDLILLDVRLPDMSGLEVCAQLRAGGRTRHIPIMFISEVSDQASRLRALELGADDYVTKPFDLDELGLRVQNTLRRMQQESLTDPRSGLPAERLVKEQIRRLMRAEGWACLGVRINQFNDFAERYPYPAGELVIRSAARLIGQVVDELGTPEDFVGQAGEVFVVITSAERGPALRDALIARFDQEIALHYDFADRQRGHLIVRDASGERQVPLMSLAVKLVTAQDNPGDIREII